MDAREPKIVAIVAVSKTGGIGYRNGLPWHLPSDLRRFKHLTLGKPVIMGFNTHESLPGPLVGRTNIVVTRDRKDRVRDGFLAVESIDEAIQCAKALTTERVFIIGGAQLYTATIHLCDEVELTVVAGDWACDTTLDINMFNAEDWTQSSRLNVYKPNARGLSHAYVRLIRKSAARRTGRHHSYSIVAELGDA